MAVLPMTLAGLQRSCLTMFLYTTKSSPQKRSFAREDERMFIYCLFCDSGKSRYVVKAVEAKMACRAISPKQIQHTWSKGKMVDIERDMLPGYVFLYFNEEKPEVSYLKAIQGVVSCLRDSGGNYELAGGDEQFALMLLEKNGKVGKTPVFRVGQRITICEGAFAGLKTEILKVDRRSSRMLVYIPFANQVVKTWLEYEIVESDEPDTAEESETNEK